MAMLDPLFMDINEVYSGDEFGLPYRDLISEGVVGADDFEVTAGSGNTVDVAAGAAWVEGDTLPARQPTYRCYNDATVNVGISPDPTNPRKVALVIQVTDEAFDGTGREAEIQALHGTAAPSPAEPTIPDSALVLAMLDVPAAAADSSAYTITDRRVRAFGLNSLSGGAAEGQVPVWNSIDGRWEPGSAGAVLYRKNTEEDVTNTVTETDLLNGEITLAAGILGTNRTARGTLRGDYLQNMGGTAAYRLKLKFGGTVVYDDTFSVGSPSSLRRGWAFDFTLTNLDATNVQWLDGMFRLTDTSSGATVGVGSLDSTPAKDGAFTSNGPLALDTTTAVLVELTCTLDGATTTRSMRLKHALVEIV